MKVIVKDNRDMVMGFVAVCVGCSSFRFAFSGYERASRVRKPYDFSSFLTIFSLPRGLDRGEEATDGTISGTR